MKNDGECSIRFSYSSFITNWIVSSMPMLMRHYGRLEKKRSKWRMENFRMVKNLRCDGRQTLGQTQLHKNSIFFSLKRRNALRVRNKYKTFAITLNKSAREWGDVSHSHVNSVWVVSVVCIRRVQTQMNVHLLWIGWNVALELWNFGWSGCTRFILPRISCPFRRQTFRSRNDKTKV